MTWIIRLFKRTGALLRRTIDTEIALSDLPQGMYARGVSEKRQTVKNHKPYGWRTMVSRGKKSWIVLSDRPLYSHFQIIADGTTNREA